MNYYNLFEIPNTPVVDKLVIAKKYVELQKQYHPDFYTTNTENAQDEALEISAQINKAYNIFKKEDKTLEYFLQQNNVIIVDEKYNLPPDFLMEMMELNELIDENKQSDEEINNFKQTIELQAKPYLTHDENIKNDEKAMQQLKLYYYKKKYLHRILERLED
jgi:molecular chaperone HscB